jgi:hypothetical protein
MTVRSKTQGVLVATTRYASFLRLPLYRLNAFSVDGTKTPNGTLFQFSLQHLPAFKRLSSLSFAHSMPIKDDSGRIARKVVWRKQSSANWIAEVQDEIES